MESSFSNNWNEENMELICKKCRQSEMQGLDPVAMTEDNRYRYENEKGEEVATLTIYPYEKFWYCPTCGYYTTKKNPDFYKKDGEIHKSKSTDVNPGQYWPHSQEEAIFVLATGILLGTVGAFVVIGVMSVFFGSIVS